jgi:2-hydroxy-6-oxonona-2,4-dienedioate hydrolase
VSHLKKESGFLTVDQANLYFETAGDGDPLVFIHAGVADSRQWNREFETFSQDYRVLRYDLRGYGKSVPVEGDFSHLGDLLHFLDAQSISQPMVLIGCSMGGTLAMDFTLEYPERVKRLIMIGSGPSGLDLDVQDHPKAAEAEKAYEAGDLDTLAELEAQIWFDGMGRTSEQVDPQMRALALEMNRLALSHEAKKLGERKPNIESVAAERLAEIQIPVLIIVGENDIPYLLAAADYMEEHLSSSQKIIFENAAHLLNMDQPDEFRAVVRSFLSRSA